MVDGRDGIDSLTSQIFHDARLLWKYRVFSILDVLFALKSINFLCESPLDTVNFSESTIVEFIDNPVALVDDLLVLAKHIV